MLIKLYLLHTTSVYLLYANTNFDTYYISIFDSSLNGIKHSSASKTAQKAFTWS